MTEPEKLLKPKHHNLKCWPPYFQMVKSGKKTFELRKNDRDFCENDTVQLMEFNPDTNGFTGRVFNFTISYVLESPRWLRDGVCALGITRPREPINEEAVIDFVHDKLKEHWMTRTSPKGIYTLACYIGHQLCLRFHIPGECPKCKEYETQLEAWFSIFGTTQLTHAQARLEAAERKAEKFNRQAKEPGKWK